MSNEAAPARVSTLELFFDLVFVFTITQVSELVLHAHGTGDLGRAALILLVVWWMYGGFAWLTNNVGTEKPKARILILAATAGFLVMALAIPQAFGRDGFAFGLAYLMVNVIHAVLFLHAPNESARAIFNIAPFNLSTAALIAIAGLTPPAWSIGLWLTAVAVLILAPLSGRTGGFAVEPAHFVERHGLVLIIALGESIISIGLGAAGEPVTLELVTASVLALALNAGIWWTYFDEDERAAEHALTRAQGRERGQMAFRAFGYGHVLMLAGIVVLAAGVKRFFQHLHDPAQLATAALLGCGLAIYLLGDLVFRRFVGIQRGASRVPGVVASLGSIAIGTAFSPLAQIASLVLVLVAVVRAGRRSREI